MEIQTALGAALLFALACNLDTIPAAVGRSAHSRGHDLADALLTAALTTAVTFLSLVLGAAGGALLPTGTADRLGGLALTGLGLWYLLDTLRGLNGQPGHGSGALALAAALAVNNAGIGLAAGIAGLSPLLAAGCNFPVTLAALVLGRRLQTRLGDSSNLALPLSGTLLILLGLWQLL